MRKKQFVKIRNKNKSQSGRNFLSGFVPSVAGEWGEACVVVCNRFSKIIHLQKCPKTLQDVKKRGEDVVVEAEEEQRTTGVGEESV